MLFFSTSEPGPAENATEKTLARVAYHQGQIEKRASRVAIFPVAFDGDEARFARILACRNGGVWSALDSKICGD